MRQLRGNEREVDSGDGHRLNIDDLRQLVPSLKGVGKTRLMNDMTKEDE